MNPALIKILRWIAFIPAAFLASVAMYYATFVAMIGGASVVSVDTEQVATYWMYTVPLLKGLAFVLGGAFVAPSHEKKVACFLFVGHVLFFTFAAVMVAYVMGQQPAVVLSVNAYIKAYFNLMGNPLREDLTFLAGVAAATYSVYKEEKAIKWVFSATNTPSS